jgi:hypothetical protein
MDRTDSGRSKWNTYIFLAFINFLFPENCRLTVHCEIIKISVKQRLCRVFFLFLWRGIVLKRCGCAIGLAFHYFFLFEVMEKVAGPVSSSRVAQVVNQLDVVCAWVSWKPPSGRAVRKGTIFHRPNHNADNQCLFQTWSFPLWAVQRTLKFQRHLEVYVLCGSKSFFHDGLSGIALRGISVIAVTSLRSRTLVSVLLISMQMRVNVWRNLISSSVTYPSS